MTTKTQLEELKEGLLRRKRYLELKIDMINIALSKIEET